MQGASNDEIFAVPLKVEDPADCAFYHTMNVHGHGLVTGHWDLRGGVVSAGKLNCQSVTEGRSERSEGEGIAVLSLHGTYGNHV
jgi:hypothetical protein